MDIYELVRSIYLNEGLNATTVDVQRSVGTLISAGFSYSVADQDIDTARQIVLRTAKKAKLKIAHTTNVSVESPITSVAKFQEIYSFMSKNTCPRCKGTMETVKLANYENVNYCSRCKVALWANN